MPAWSYNDGLSPVTTVGKPDEGAKVVAFPGLAPVADRPGGILPNVGQQGQIGVPPGGSAAWWMDFAFWAKQEFVRRAQMQGPPITNVSLSANNGAGDVGGIGVLTLTIATS